MIRPCAYANPCPSDEVLGNYSAESPDPPDYLSVFFAGRPPRLNTHWSATECGVTFVSVISQEDADLNAQAAALLCSIPPGVQVFFNQSQVCCVPCPDGTSFCYTLPSGIIPGESVAEANTLANQIACSLARRHQICISSMASECCSGAPFSATLAISGPGSLPAGNVWAIVNGFLPPGLFLTSLGGPIARISGTTNSPGQYFFSVGVRTAQGDFMSKVFGLCVIAINPVSPTLTPATQGTPYSNSFTATSCVFAGLVWSVATGTLPPGLTLDPATGALSGTPTTNGTYPFTIEVQAP